VGDPSKCVLRNSVFEREMPGPPISPQRGMALLEGHVPTRPTSDGEGRSVLGRAARPGLSRR
jgi:hypothetical protein